MKKFVLILLIYTLLFLYVSNPTYLKKNFIERFSEEPRFLNLPEKINEIQMTKWTDVDKNAAFLVVLSFPNKISVFVKDNRLQNNWEKVDISPNFRKKLKRMK